MANGAPSVEDLYVGQGEPIKPALARFERWAKASGISFNGKLFKLTQTPHGGTATFLGGGSFNHPWRVSASAEGAQISPGYVNGLEAAVGGVPLTGETKAGELVDVPTLEIAPPFNRLRSYIGVRVKANSETGEIDEEDAEAVEVVYSEDRVLVDLETAFPDPGVTVGFEPLAVLYWGPDGEFRRVRQIALHNFKFTLIAGESPRPFFSGK